MASKKGINKQGIIVITVAAIASVLIIAFIFSNPVDENKNTDKIVLDENGEASYLNLSVPNSNQKEDSLSLIDKLDKIKNDSINASKMNKTGLEEIDRNENKKKSTTVNHYVANNGSYNQNSSSIKKGSLSQKKSTSSNFKAASFDEPIKKNDNTEETIMPINKKNHKSGFFKNRKESNKERNNDEIILASVHTNQTIKNNQRVKFRTTKEFFFNGEKYPVNTIIYGMAQIKPNRLIITINKINQTDIKLEVYDSEDSEKGIYVLTPNLNASLQKELQKEGLDDDDLSRIPFSKSLKNIFEKKVKEEKVELLNNYKVLIKITKDE